MLKQKLQKHGLTIVSVYFFGLHVFHKVSFFSSDFETVLVISLLLGCLFLQYYDLEDSRYQVKKIGWLVLFTFILLGTIRSTLYYMDEKNKEEATQVDATIQIGDDDLIGLFPQGDIVISFDSTSDYYDQETVDQLFEILVLFAVGFGLFIALFLLDDKSKISVFSQENGYVLLVVILSSLLSGLFGYVHELYMDENVSVLFEGKGFGYLLVCISTIWLLWKYKTVHDFSVIVFLYLLIVCVSIYLFTTEIPSSENISTYQQLLMYVPNIPLGLAFVFSISKVYTAFRKGTLI